MSFRGVPITRWGLLALAFLATAALCWGGQDHAERAQLLTVVTTCVAAIAGLSVPKSEDE